MRYPLAWYLTWTTYGTWLHGDARGSHSRYFYQPPDPALEEAVRLALADNPVILTDEQRQIVDAALLAECAAQGWLLHARNVRTNHVHVVVSTARPGNTVRSRLKAVASDALSERQGLPMAGKNGRRRWWTEKGNVAPVEDERALEAIVVYVKELQ